MTDKSDDTSMELAVRLLRDYVKPHRGKIYIAAVCMVIAAASTAANALMLKPVIDEIFVNKNTELLMLIPLAILGIAIIKGGAVYGQSFLMKYVGQRIITDMQLVLFRHLLHADIAMFNDQSTGKLISRFTNDIQVIRRNLTNVLVGFAKETVTLILLVAVMFYQSVELAFMGFIAFPLAIYPILKLGRKMRRVSNKTQEELGIFTAQLDDTFQGVRIVKAYGNEDSEVARAKGIVERIFNLYIKAARIESIASPMMESLAGIAIASVVWYGGNQVLSGETTPGAFFSFIAALIMAYKPMKSLSGINTSLQEGLAAVKRLFIVLDTEPKIQDMQGAKPLQVMSDNSSLTNLHIEFENLVFSYKNGDTHIPAIKNISLKIPAGKRIALVGASGGGKSTIINLILRFYDPESGVIRINDVDIRKTTLESLRGSMAIVNQEATLFDDTIRANICYGKKDATENEMIAAAKSAAAHNFILEQPDGYETRIGQHGLRLSGGQRQRLAIARAMLRNAPILLLDEATSALDNVSEQQVQQALDNLMTGRTTIVIAHRLSTIINADLIYVVDNGKIAEYGTHEELLKNNSIYSTLYQRQFR